MEFEVVEVSNFVFGALQSRWRIALYSAYNLIVAGQTQ